VKWTDLGLTGEATVRDLWSRQDLGKMSDGYTSTLPSHGAQLLRITPAEAPIAQSRTIKVK
jgi:hypothetical protein